MLRNRKLNLVSHLSFKKKKKNQGFWETEALLLYTSLPLRISRASFFFHSYLSILILLYHSFIPCHHLSYSRVLAIQRSLSGTECKLSLHLSPFTYSICILSAQSEVRISSSFSLINPSHLSLLTGYCLPILSASFTCSHVSFCTPLFSFFSFLSVLSLFFCSFFTLRLYLDTYIS